MFKHNRITIRVLGTGSYSAKQRYLTIFDCTTLYSPISRDYFSYYYTERPHRWLEADVDSQCACGGSMMVSRHSFRCH